MQERLSVRKGGPTPCNAAKAAREGRACACVGRDSMPSVRSLPRSQGEARAVPWPCLPVAFQDFPTPCQSGGSGEAPLSWPL